MSQTAPPAVGGELYSSYAGPTGAGAFMRTLFLGLLLVLAGCGQKEQNKGAPKQHAESYTVHMAHPDEAERARRERESAVEERYAAGRMKAAELLHHNQKIDEEMASIRSTYLSASDAEKRALDVRLHQLRKQKQANEEAVQHLLAMEYLNGGGSP
jgi:hypothetical protein